MESKRSVLEEQAMIRANRWKKARYLGSGLFIILVGIAILIVGLSVMRQAYSTESLIVGLGVLIIIIGLLRSLIGLINPILPVNLPSSDSPLPRRRLTDVLFGRDSSNEE